MELLHQQLGATFAPTAEAAMNGPREGGIAGVPQAIQILSLALPRILGQARLADMSLLTSRGGGGMDPATAAALQRYLARVMRPVPRPTPLDDGPGSSGPAAPDGGRTRGPQAPAPPLPVPGSPYFRVEDTPRSPFTDTRGPSGGGPFGY